MHSHMNRSRRKRIVKPAQLAEKEYSENRKWSSKHIGQTAICNRERKSDLPRILNAKIAVNSQCCKQTANHYQSKPENHLRKAKYVCLLLCVNVQLNQCQAAAVQNDFVEISFMQKTF